MHGETYIYYAQIICLCYILYIEESSWMYVMNH